MLNASARGSHISEKQDSTENSVKSRQILFGQKLFVLKTKRIRRKKGKKIEFSACLKPAFEVIQFDHDTSFVLVKWTLLKNSYHLQAGNYKQGTASYLHIDSLIQQNHLTSLNQ